MWLLVLFVILGLILSVWILNVIFNRAKAKEEPPVYPEEQVNDYQESYLGKPSLFSGARISYRYKEESTSLPGLTGHKYYHIPDTVV